MTVGKKATPREDETKALKIKWREARGKRTLDSLLQRGDIKGLSAQLRDGGLNSLTVTLTKMAAISGSQAIFAAIAELHRLGLTTIGNKELASWLNCSEERILHDKQVDDAEVLYIRGYSQKQAAQHIVAASGTGDSFEEEVRKVEETLRNNPGLQELCSMSLGTRRYLGRQFEFMISVMPTLAPKIDVEMQAQYTALLSEKSCESDEAYRIVVEQADARVAEARSDFMREDGRRLKPSKPSRNTARGGG